MVCVGGGRGQKSDIRHIVILAGCKDQDPDITLPWFYIKF